MTQSEKQKHCGDEEVVKELVSMKFTLKWWMVSRFKIWNGFQQLNSSSDIMLQCNGILLCICTFYCLIVFFFQIRILVNVLYQQCLAIGVSYDNIAHEGSTVSSLEIFCGGLPRMVGLSFFPRLCQFTVWGQNIKHIEGLECCPLLRELWVVQCHLTVSFVCTIIKCVMPWVIRVWLYFLLGVIPTYCCTVEFFKP